MVSRMKRAANFKVLMQKPNPLKGVATKTKRELLADAIKREMRRRNWQQAEVAKECGMSEGTVSNLLLTKVDASPRVARQLAQCFQWSPNTIERIYMGEITEERQLLIDGIVHRLRELDEVELRRALGVLDALYGATAEDRPGSSAERTSETAPDAS